MDSQYGGFFGGVPVPPPPPGGGRGGAIHAGPIIWASGMDSQYGGFEAGFRSPLPYGERARERGSLESPMVVRDCPSPPAMRPLLRTVRGTVQGPHPHRGEGSQSF